MKKMYIKQIITIGIVAPIIISMYSVPVSAAWAKNSQNQWNWLDESGKATGWKEINNKWYYFNDDGEMCTGWLQINEIWYNLSNEGIMNTGWQNIGSHWYRFDQNGAMNTGWIQENGNWYFMNHNGQMETGTVEVDGKIYTFSDDGIMKNDNETIKNVETAEFEQNINDAKTDDTTSSTDEKRKGYVCTNGDSLNIRSSASVSSSIIGSLPKGSEVMITDKEKNGFLPINAGGTNGWVSADWISFNKVQSDTEQLDNDNFQSKKDSVNIGGIRTKQPDLDDNHYYSDENIFYKAKLSPPFTSGGRVIKGNCTWYAWGRAWEITGVKPTDAGFIGNAYEWWEANKSNGKYRYGSEPRVGAIAVWNSNLPNSGGFGHVAIVEKIDNNKVYISESMWHGDVFRYGPIYDTDYLDGYIYIDKPNF